jgi:hypothetical protein
MNQAPKWAPDFHVLQKLWSFATQPSVLHGLSFHGLNVSIRQFTQRCGGQ